MTRRGLPKLVDACYTPLRNISISERGMVDETSDAANSIPVITVDGADWWDQHAKLEAIRAMLETRCRFSGKLTIQATEEEFGAPDAVLGTPLEHDLDGAGELIFISPTLCVTFKKAPTKKQRAVARTLTQAAEEIADALGY